MINVKNNLRWEKSLKMEKLFEFFPEGGIKVCCRTP
jgi:hypothetical protein